MTPDLLDRQRIIGLTGGIATGKSTVADYLAITYGVPILDADVYARQAVVPGLPIWEQILRRYGPAILLNSGELNRQALGELIFRQPEERAWLEAQIHPYVRDRLLVEKEKLSEQPAIVMVIPLLFEAGMTDLVTEVWVVTCSLSLQLQRLTTRNRLTVKQAQDRINSQMPLAEKVAQADVVLDNNTTREALLLQVDRAWQRWNKA